MLGEVLEVATPTVTAQTVHLSAPVLASARCIHRLARHPVGEGLGRQLLCVPHSLEIQLLWAVLDISSMTGMDSSPVGHMMIVLG